MKKLLYFCVALLLCASCTKHQEDVACKIQVITDDSAIEIQNISCGKKADKLDTSLGSYAAKYFVPYDNYVQISWQVEAKRDYDATYETTYNPNVKFCVKQATELEVHIGYTYNENGYIKHYCKVGGKEVTVNNVNSYY